jgi:membrane associated rhomboid family serine protease
MGFRSSGSSPYGTFQPRLTPGVKGVLVFLAIAFVLQKSAESFFQIPVDRIFGFAPLHFFSGSVWQVLTYPFLHGSLTHLLFNGLVLYMLGSELELRWGTRRFLGFLSGCALGGACLQTIVWFVGITFGLGFAESMGTVPVVGASGALYGLFYAFGKLNAESLVLVFFVLPLKAKHFVMVLFFIEVISAIFYGQSSGVAHLVHLGGLFAGAVILYWRGPFLLGRPSKARLSRAEVKRRMSLIVSDQDKPKKPSDWN